MCRTVRNITVAVRLENGATVTVCTMTTSRVGAFSEALAQCSRMDGVVGMIILSEDNKEGENITLPVFNLLCADVAHA